MNGPFGVEISKKQCSCDCDKCKTSCNCDCAKCTNVSKASKSMKAVQIINGKGARQREQVVNQLQRVGAQKGSKSIQLRHAKAVAGAKFQNK